MPVLRFPDPESTGPDGLVAVGGDLHPESLLLAYRQGIFPWPMEGLPLTWFSPVERAVLDFDRLHLPRSLEKLRRKNPFTYSVGRAFEAVIRACAETKRKGQPGTWITDEMLEAYVELHRKGYAQSVEVWKSEKLVGGIYGVEVDGVFSAESMFHLETGASKLALLYLIDQLRARGFEWIDIQVMTPHLKALGARAIPRKAFLARLARAHAPRKKRTSSPRPSSR